MRSKQPFALSSARNKQVCATVMVLGLETLRPINPKAHVLSGILYIRDPLGFHARVMDLKGFRASGSKAVALWIEGFRAEELRVSGVHGQGHGP